VFENVSNATKINIKQAKTFLASYLEAVPSEVSLIGEGAWSQGTEKRRKGSTNHRTDSFDE
jgi:hypothetical protein